VAFDRQFLDFMPDTVQIAPFISYDRFKVAAYGPAVTYQARISGKMVALRRADKQEDANIMDVWIGARVDGLPLGTTRITIEDQLTLPNVAAYPDFTPVIFTVGRWTDDTGQHHIKVQCGWMYHRQGQ
jgi:hypothetical protein